METALQYLLVLLGGACVAIADVLIKRAAHPHEKLLDALNDPIMIPVALLYLCQIVIFSYVFLKRWELGLVGVLQMVCYTIIIIISGALFFNEKVTIPHAIGIVAAITGIVLMNI
jgi:drug/metabolite transporter (DMT)-like permease